MPSPRSRFETACRVGAFAILGWLLGNSVIPDTTRRVQRVSGVDARAHLADWTRSSASDAVHLTFDAAPDAWVADWLGALRHSGRLVTWSGSPAPLAISASAIPDPMGGVRIDVSAPAGAKVSVSDDAGVIDSVHVVGFGATIAAPVAVGYLRASMGDARATAPLPDSAAMRSVLVVAAAGWEGKYVASALEERGWKVAARFSVAPGVNVAQGATQPLDTSRYAAVVAIDSTIDTLAPEVERFVRSGGGLVLAGRAGASRRMAALAPGSLDARTRPAVKPADTLRLGTTGFYPVSALKSDAVTLEQRDGRVAVAARRIAAGRVVQLGYDDSWRWRMAGGPSSEAAHRDWWARVVASVAYVPPARVSVASNEAAPLARLVDRLGDSRPAPASHRPSVDPRILITLMMILLLSEWASRRLRGLR